MYKIITPDFGGSISWERDGVPELNDIVRLEDGREIPFRVIATKTNGDVYDWFDDIIEYESDKKIGSGNNV